MAFAPVFQRSFSATFDRRAAAAAGNGLLNNLIAYWKLDEASGDALDAHTNALTLTQTGAVGTATGIIGTSRTWDGTINNYLARAADDPLLSTGDVDFTIAAWVYLSSKTAQVTILSKYQTTTNNREYQLSYNPTPDRFQFIVSSDGTFTPGATTLVATSAGAPSLSAWYHVIASHDAVNNKIWLFVNNNAGDSVAHSTGVFDSAARFALGLTNPAASQGQAWNGRLDETGFWKSAAGGGGVLTAAQRTALYNSGAGLAYAAFTT